VTLGEELDASRRQAFVGMDMPWLLEQWVARTPDKPFMIWAPFTGPEAAWTFRDLQRQARQVAAGLQARDVGAGDFVIIHLDNSPEFVIAWFACAELGAVAVSTNTRSVARDLAYFAEHTQAAAAITQPAFAALVDQACPELRAVCRSARQ
jgi:crotonobetaine/carnitine-CoA ligase